MPSTGQRESPTVTEVTSQTSRLQATAAMSAAVLLALLFLASGLWKLSDLHATAERMVQSLVPVYLSWPAAVAVAALETFAGVLLLVPRYRRWGACLAAILLAAFLVYIAVLYDRLLGDDCNCFPWIRRVVGPAFFVGDAAMLGLAAMAGWRSSRSADLRGAAAIFGVVLAMTGIACAANSVTRFRSDVPAVARVDGEPLELRRGKVLLYFFDPECSHCYMAGTAMASRNWRDTRVVVVPTREPQFARDFLETTKLAAGISPDAQSLREALPFTDPPYAVALDRGRVVATFNSGEMEGEAWFQALQQSGHVK